MNNPIGQNRWAIAEGYIPETSHGPEPEMTSHETACLLNTSNQDAHAFIYGVPRVHEDHGRRHNVANDGFFGRMSLKNDFTGVVALGDDAYESALGNHKQGSDTEMRHFFDCYKH